MLAECLVTMLLYYLDMTSCASNPVATLYLVFGMTSPFDRVPTNLVLNTKVMNINGRQADISLMAGLFWAQSLQIANIKTRWAFEFDAFG